MKTFISSAVVVVVILVLTSVSLRAQERVEGTYVVFSNDQKIETDEFVVVPGEMYSDDIRSVGAQEDHKVANMVCSKGSLESYEQTFNGLPATKATNDRIFFKLFENEATIGQFSVDEDILFLDPNMYSQYWFLLKVFEEKRQDKVRFNVCVPQIQDFVYVDIEKRGSEVISTAEKTINATQYRITVGKKEIITCWTDHDRLIGMYLTSKNVYVADEKYNNLYASLKKIVNRAM